MKIQLSHNKCEIDMMSACKYLHNFSHWNHCVAMKLMMGGSTIEKICMWKLEKWEAINPFVHALVFMFIFAQRQFRMNEWKIALKFVSTKSHWMLFAFLSDCRVDKLTEYYWKQNSPIEIKFYLLEIILLNVEKWKRIKILNFFILFRGGGTKMFWNFSWNCYDVELSKYSHVIYVREPMHNFTWYRDSKLFSASRKDRAWVSKIMRRYFHQGLTFFLDISINLAINNPCSLHVMILKIHFQIISINYHDPW